MPISPCSGSLLRMRHRKPWRRSSGVGCLNAVIKTPCGFMPPITWVIVPSLPLVSMPCSTIKSDRLCSANSRSCRLKSFARCFFRSRVSRLRFLSPGVESASTSAIRKRPSFGSAWSRLRIRCLATDRSVAAGLLGQFDRYDLERDEVVVAEDVERQLRPDVCLDHQALKVARLGDAGFAD